MFDDDKTLDLTLQKGIEEGRVVAEGYASVRLAIGTEHVRMGKYTRCPRLRLRATQAVLSPLAGRRGKALPSRPGTCGQRAGGSRSIGGGTWIRL